MNQISMMQVKQRLSNLIYDILFVLLLQLSRFAVLPNQGVQVNIHMLENKVDVFIVFSTNHLLKRYDVVVTQLPQKHDLPVRPLSISRI